MRILIKAVTNYLSFFT